MKRRNLEDYQRERAGKQHTTPGDEERKARIKAHGQECLRRLKGDQTWEDWMGAGEALMVITEEAVVEIGASVWDGNNKRLVREFTERWDAYEAEAGSNYKPLTKQERWALREVMTNPEIGAFRGQLDGPIKRRLNHPNAVINKWKANTRAKEPKERKPSPPLSNALKEKNKVIEQLQARNAELEEEVAGRGKSDGGNRRAEIENVGLRSEIEELKAQLAKGAAPKAVPPPRPDATAEEELTAAIVAVADALARLPVEKMADWGSQNIAAAIWTQFEERHPAEFQAYIEAWQKAQAQYAAKYAKGIKPKKVRSSSGSTRS